MRPQTAVLALAFAGCVADTRELSALTSARPGESPERSGGLVVAPSRLDFGTRDPACGPASLGLILLNEGPFPITIEAARIEGDGERVFSRSLPGPPVLLGPGARVEARVGFDDEAPETGATRRHEATLSLLARLENDRLLRVERPLIAVTDDAPVRTDRFVQNRRRASDVLFVIDDSASMVAEQDALGRNFVAFLDAAQDSLVDYQIGVTTTDLSPEGERGRLVPVRTERDNQMGARTAHIVTRASLPSPNEAFRRNALVGIEGAPTEQGLEAAARALTPPLIEDDNAGFLREEADLALVFVSDEDDGSPRSPVYYADLFRGLKGDDDRRLTASAIVGPGPNGCGGPGDRATAGLDYIELTERLRGRVESICTDDWGSTLARLSGVAFGLEGRFRLSGRPDGEPTVRVDGVPRLRINPAGETVWSVDPETNVLSFGRSFTPGEGSEIEVTYPVACPRDDGRS